MRIGLVDPDSDIYKPILYLKSSCHKQTLVKWSYECVNRLLPAYEEANPGDISLKMTLEKIENWLNTNELSRKDYRKALSNLNASLKKAKTEFDKSVCSAFICALKTTKSKEESVYASIYALHAAELRDDTLIEETNFQFSKLIELARLDKQYDDGDE